MPRIKRLNALFLIAVFSVVAGTPVLAQAPSFQKVIIAAPKPYSNLVSNIQRLGGTVKRQYKYVDAVAAEVPSGSLSDLRGMVGPGAVSKDAIIPGPGKPLGVLPTQIDIAATAPVSGGTPIFPQEMPPADSYRLNHQDLNLRALHEKRLTGEKPNGDRIVVAVIDSGLRPGFAALDLDGSDIGGEDFVEDGRSYRDRNNDPHGSAVATMISGNAKFQVGGNFRSSLNEHLPGVVIGGNTLHLFGTAPLSGIYSLRVFSDPTAGAPISRVMAAMERVIELRETYDKGDLVRGRNIQVCNISLGTFTLYSGRTELEKLGDEMLRKGIIPIFGGGYIGPSALTVSSPGSSFSALTVGAASYTPNERVFRDMLFERGAGLLHRPSAHTQTAWFSSRGPNADGHTDPDVTANGSGNITQGYAGRSTITVTEGTSFSTAIVSGVAALLRQAFPNATAAQIRNAMVETANDKVFGDRSGILDRGHGVVDALAAFQLLEAGHASNSLPFHGSSRDVEQNVEANTDRTVEHGIVWKTFENLVAGQKAEILYAVPEGTAEVSVEIKGFTLEDPAHQNQLFGDDIFLNIHSAKTSSFALGDYPVSAFTTGGIFVVQDPEPGIMRITLMGDYSNAGTVRSVSVDVDSKPRQNVTDVTAAGNIRDLEVFVIPVRIPPGVSQAEFRLSWGEDWGSYPTNDLDLLFEDPRGVRNEVDGFTFNSPEVVRVSKPRAGIWTFYVSGFSIPLGADKFELRILADGRVLK